MANEAIALTAANFISSLMVVALTSSAPLKINGNPRTLFTWFGWSDLPVAIIISLRADVASLYDISGSGFAKANTIGSFAIARIMSLLTSPPRDNPKNTSAPENTSSKAFRIKHKNVLNFGPQSMV